MGRKKRFVIGNLAFMLILAGSVLVAPPALAFHESTISDASVLAGAQCSQGGVFEQAQDVKAFNGTVTQSNDMIDARASQNTSVSGTSDLAVSTSADLAVTVTDPAAACGEARAFMRVSPIEDDPDVTEYFVQVSGELSFEADPNVDAAACMRLRVANIFEEERCPVSEAQTIPVNASGFSSNPFIEVSGNIAAGGDVGSATFHWDLTFTAFSEGSCPAFGSADAGGVETAPPGLAPAQTASADGSDVEAAAECQVPVVSFESDVGFDGDITEAEVVSFRVTLSPAQTTEVVVRLEVKKEINQEALPDQDFVGESGRDVTLDPGTTSIRIDVALITDTNAEPDEAFRAVISPSAANSTPVTFGKTEALAIIRDDDCAVHMPSAIQSNNVTVPNGTGAVCGSIRPDVIVGSNVADNILGGAGNDVLIGRQGQDTLNGGLGDDQLYGGSADGTPFAQPGEQDISRDFLTGGPPEFLQPGALDFDSDEIFGEKGNDFIDGGIGNDKLNGGEGDDDIAGGKGVDSPISGGPGNDTLFASDRPEPLIVANTAAYLTEDTNDSLFGDADNDTLHGSSGNNGLFGGPGNDTIYGHGGQDSLLGEAGSDTLLEGPLFSFDLVGDILNGGNSGADRDTCISTPIIDVERNCEL